MSTRLRRLSVPAFAAALVASLAIAAPAAQAADCAGADLQPSSATMSVVSSATLCLLNNERTSRGLSSLSTQPLLASVATTYSQSMVDQRFFAHVSPAGELLSTRLKGYVAGARDWVVGENLAWGEGAKATPAQIVDAWMHSDGHRANILNGEFREIGIGIVNGTPIGSQPATSATYTTEFGRADMPASAPAATTAVSASTPIASAATKRRIRASCRRSAKRTHSSRTRKTRVARCVSTKLRTVARRAQ